MTENERLTYYLVKNSLNEGYCLKPGVDMQTAIDRLAKYEKNGPVAHYAELVKAEKEGRLVVLPCKVGDTVYYVGKNSRRCYGDLGYRCQFPVEGCYHRVGHDCHEEENGVYSVISVKFELSHFDFGLRKPVSWIYLTREEAEAALQKEGK